MMYQVKPPVFADPLQEVGTAEDHLGGSWPLDAHETGLLAVLRHLLRSHAQPESQGWEIALQIALERWGAASAGRILLAANAFVRALRKARAGDLLHSDPLDPVARGHLGPEERRMMRMLQAMRRDLAPAARAEMALLTGGRIEPALVRTGIALARCLPVPGQGGVLCDVGPGLRQLH